jgi:hypothetical protein
MRRCAGCKEIIPDDERNHHCNEDFERRQAAYNRHADERTPSDYQNYGTRLAVGFRMINGSEH